jgi:mRNA interferase RelE/StbE
MDTEYKIILSNKFDKTFSRLDKNIQNQIVERLMDLSKNPKTGKPLKGKFKGLRSLRAGKYRILYEIRENLLLIVVIAIGHRKKVYE